MSGGLGGRWHAGGTKHVVYTLAVATDDMVGCCGSNENALLKLWAFQKLAQSIPASNQHLAEQACLPTAGTLSRRILLNGCVCFAGHAGWLETADVPVDSPLGGHLLRAAACLNHAWLGQELSIVLYLALFYYGLV